MQSAADTFFPLLKIVQKQMPDGSTTEDTLLVMEHVAKLAQKARKDNQEKARDALFGFNKQDEEA
jgi:hypothetical protein